MTPLLLLLFIFFSSLTVSTLSLTTTVFHILFYPPTLLFMRITVSPVFLFSVNAGWIRLRRLRRFFRRRKPVYPQSVSGSVLEQRDPKRSAQASISALEGVPFECGGLGHFRQARGAERSVLALAGVLRLREPALLSRFIGESGEAREGLELCSVRGPELHQLRHGSARRDRLVPEILG